MQTNSLLKRAEGTGRSAIRKAEALKALNYSQPSAYPEPMVSQGVKMEENPSATDKVLYV